MPVLIERPHMSIEMWAALKNHILKRREKKKQELADAAIQQQYEREQENKRKENAMTLEEIKEEISQVEKKLQTLKDEKHEMFLYLKRVLDKKRNVEDNKEANNDLMQSSHHYLGQNQNIPPVAASNLYMIAGNRVLNRNQVMYKVGTIPTQQQNGVMKRQRSPSPPPTTNYSAYNAYKSHAQAYASPSFPIHPSSQYPTQEQAKHLPSSYHVPHMPPGYVGSLPQQMDHQSQKPSSMQEEKYYIQAGGISAGYPIRTQQQPPSHFQPPTSHSVTAPIQVPLRKEDVMRRNMNNEHR